jgi:hypothetical protein
MIDSPKEVLYKKDEDIYKFLETTPKDSVYAIYFGNFKLDVPNIGHRAVLSGNGFPFNESYFREYQQRKESLYGNKDKREKIDGKWIGEKMSKFFRKLKPKDFMDIAKKYKLDYVLIESDYSSNFKTHKPKFENKKVKIYKVSDFKEKK